MNKLKNKKVVDWYSIRRITTLCVILSLIFLLPYCLSAHPAFSQFLGKIFIYSLIFGGLFIGLPIILFLTGKEIIIAIKENKEAILTTLVGLVLIVLGIIVFCWFVSLVHSIPPNTLLLIIIAVAIIYK